MATKPVRSYNRKGGYRTIKVKTGTKIVSVKGGSVKGHRRKSK